jgi:holliday junction DNA helicase RuvA
MIGYLKGKIIHSEEKSVILLVAGVGYKLYTNSGALDGDITEKEFWTYLAVRETALDLYGFPTREELRFFELLLTVSGIGPKSAMGILSIATTANLRHAITTGDTGHLVKVSGVSKKNAEKIVIELRGKMDDMETGESRETGGDIDALEALISLGYTEKDARDALKKVVDIKDAGDKVRKALKLLS